MKGEVPLYSKVLSATGQKELDQLIGYLTRTTIPPVTYKEGVLKLAESYQPDTVILSAHLEGQISNEDLLYDLRKQGIRVIMLIGDTPTDHIRKRWIPLGVYDFIEDPVTEEKLKFALDIPSTLGMAEEKLMRIEQGLEDNNQEKETQAKKGFGFPFFKLARKDEPKQEAETPNAFSFGPAPVTPKPEAEPNFDFHEPKPEPKPAFGFHEPKSSEPVFDFHESEPKSEPFFSFHEPKPEPEPVFSFHEPKTEKADSPKSASHIETPTSTINWNFQKEPPKKEKSNVEAKTAEEQENNVKEFRFETQTHAEKVTLPHKGFNIVVLSPTSSGKTYVAINLATMLSRQGAKTELVGFEGDEDIWTYLDLPIMEVGMPKGLPNLSVVPIDKMQESTQYRVIDLPYEHWNLAREWKDALYLYVTDMDIVHRKKGMKAIDQWQGRKLLHVLNRFVGNVLDSGQEQKLRLEADIVFSDQPAHYMAMRFGRPVSMIDQAAAREFEMAVKTVQKALPLGHQQNVFAIR